MTPAKTFLFLALLAFSLQPVNAQFRRGPQDANRSEKTTDEKKEAKTPANLDDFIKPETTIMEGMTPVNTQDKRTNLGIPDTLL